MANRKVQRKKQKAVPLSNGVKKLIIGFVGQGFVGKSYADDFARRGFKTIRYALERPYRENKEKIRDADIVFICVPAPTTPKGFDSSIVETSLNLVGNGKIAVIKSTMLPGLTQKLQKKFAKITVLFSPEFLNASTAAEDAARPFANIVGLPEKSAKHVRAARTVHRILPKAKFSQTVASGDAEIYKYAHNISGFMQILTYNMVYDLAQKLGAAWSSIEKALEHDPMVSNWYIRPVHKSGRGAGGMCFIKDFAAFARHYEEIVGKPEGIALLRAAEAKNISLLHATKKDLDLLKGVYGEKALFKRNGAKKGKKR